MKRWLAALALMIAATGSAHADDALLAKTQSGVVRGVEVGGAVVFKGIPFAAPPVGPLRWEPPAPPAAWTGVRDGALYGPICTQPPRPDGALAAGGDRPQSEDCLYLLSLIHISEPTRPY